jgi:Zn-dependent protease with chaperone function
MHVPKFIPVFLVGSFASIFNAAIFNGFTGGQNFATLIFVIGDIGGLFVVCLFLMLIMRRQRTAADSQKGVAG